MPKSIGYYYFITNLLNFVMESYISGNTTKYQVIEKFKMGDPFCNDPRCKRNRNEEKHEAHNGRIILKEMTAERSFDTTDVYPYYNDTRCQTKRGGKT